MNHQLTVQFRSRPEVLERILRVTRHRGFAVTEMDMRYPSANAGVMKLTVCSQRSIQLLQHQLLKLVDVNECQVAQLETMQASATA
ncbi:acetolactate synthase 2 small subunit [Paraferrimonas sedimenticola]|uniref:Acetolactate synthase n=1 Tax=Paraferrimonas sedimenticola TaxID=375674 RepID=A0AA37RRB0_9GAMM|nr:acetolactate synthase 2 small subunit [Paraferrimonas sedimenticola]GLP95255.1 acetolactate synthase [Paraferrimonas sedimenticola]